MLYFLLGILFWQVLGTILWAIRKEEQEVLVILCIVPLLIIKAINLAFKLEKRFTYRRIFIKGSRWGEKIFINDYNYEKYKYEIKDLITNSKITIDGCYYTRKNLKSEEYKQNLIIKKLSELNL